MLEKLKRWYELLCIEGKGTKQQVREEIAEMIKLYIKIYQEVIKESK